MDAEGTGKKDRWKRFRKKRETDSLEESHIAHYIKENFQEKLLLEQFLANLANELPKKED